MAAWALLHYLKLPSNNPNNIREAQSKDAEALLDLFQALDSETHFMLFEPEERSTTLEQQKQILEHLSSSKTSIMLVEGQETLSGFCVLQGGTNLRNQHTASLIIGVIQSSWRQGVASRLIETNIFKAKELNISRIELTVHTKNTPAITLYKKYGFEIEGERKSSLNIDNRYCNEYYMAKHL